MKHLAMIAAALCLIGNAPVPKFPFSSAKSMDAVEECVADIARSVSYVSTVTRGENKRTVRFSVIGPNVTMIAVDNMVEISGGKMHRNLRRKMLECL